MNRFLAWINRQLEPFDFHQILGLTLSPHMMDFSKYTNIGITPIEDDDEEKDCLSDMSLESISSGSLHSIDSPIKEVDNNDDEDRYSFVSQEDGHDYGDLKLGLGTDDEDDNNLSTHSPQQSSSAEPAYLDDSLINHFNGLMENNTSSSVASASAPPKPKKMTVYETIFQSIQAAYLKGDPNFRRGPDHPLTIRKIEAENEKRSRTRYVDYETEIIVGVAGTALPSLPFDEY